MAAEPEVFVPEEDTNPDGEEGAGAAAEEGGEAVCAACTEAIDGPFVNACNKKFHPEHFVCTHCKNPFPDGVFFEHDGMPYDEECFTTNFGSKCGACGEIISGRSLTALNQKWHPEHFVCIECSKSLAGGSFVDYEGKPHCKDCAKIKRADKNKPKGVICARCKEPIEKDWIVLQGQKMHPYHFSCHKCKCAFKGGVGCHEYEGQLYCEVHYRELQQAQCAQCRKSITGRAVTALGKQWHPEHFCCAYCEQPFGGNNFMVQENKPYCEQHWTMLFGNLCGYCRRNISGDKVNINGRVFHHEHFVCFLCDAPFGKEKYITWESKPCCKRCYAKVPKAIRERNTKISDAERKAAASE